MKDSTLADWLVRFRQDRRKAAKDYWQEIYRGQQEAFTQGLAEPPHQEHGFITK